MAQLLLSLPDDITTESSRPTSARAARPWRMASSTTRGSGHPSSRKIPSRRSSSRLTPRRCASRSTRSRICQSTIGIGDTRPLLPALYRYLLVPLLLRRTFAEHERQEAAVRASHLDWTIVRAGALTDGERTARYRHGFPPSERSIAFEISRADVASFMLDLVADGAYLRESPSVSY